MTVKNSLLLSPPVEVREQTDAFRLRMLRALSKIYDELKENGETKLGRRRAWVAEKLSVSPATIGIYEFVDKHLSEPFKEQLTSGDLDLTVANKIAQMEPERQEQLWEESRETPDLSVSDVQGFAETGTLKKEEAKGKSKAKPTTLWNAIPTLSTTAHLNIWTR